jgi:NAD(P)-dependent dehydrogenase (short-subunit alcohol dehydrogenase family)
MNIDLSNRVALVTGSSLGIGRGIALQLAQCGASVVITSNDPISLNKTKNELLSLGASVLAIEGDASVESDIETIVSQSLRHFGKIDILVNNVGHIGRVDVFEHFSLAEWLSLFQLNVMSGVSFSQKISPVMKRNQWGRILFISSEKAVEPGKGMAPYAMTKTAQLSLVKSLANELGEYGITVNSVSPGVILTPAWDKNADEANLSREAFAKQYCRNVFKTENLGQPTDVASLICYLCSEYAKWITGSNIRIDGGSVNSLAL